MLLTHAHLDHSGWLPVLVRSGFAGKVFCSAGTAGLVEILLKDAAHLEEEQAAWLKRKHKSKHADPQPLFTSADADDAISRLCCISSDTDVEVRPGLVARLTPAGHILGASSIHLVDVSDGASVVFSGDVGRPNDVLLPAPEPPPRADTLVLESTYGGRRHDQLDPKIALADIVTRTVKRGGIVMIPAFAVGRAQTVLHLLRELTDEGAIPKVPVFLNSPMATEVTELTFKHHGALRISEDESRRMCALVNTVRTPEASKALNKKTGPMIVIAGSGMMTGGRIVHHLSTWGLDARNTIVVVGFQAPGTRGATLLGGANSLRMFGADVPINAEVIKLDMLSGHADGDELLAWVRSFSWRPRQVLLNHGEPDAADALRLRIERELGIPARVVLEHERIEVAAGDLTLHEPEA